MTYKITTDSPKKGEDKWSASLKVPDERVIVGYGKDEMRAMLDVIRLAWDRL